MQTFLSEPTFAESAAVLDSVRLNKQLLEGYQILNAIVLTPNGPRTVKINGRYPFSSNHPATNQWRGSECVLYIYLEYIKNECKARGIKWDKNWTNIVSLFNENPQLAGNIITPAWWLDEDAKNKMMFSHKASLYRKDESHYSQYAGVAGRFAETLAFDPKSVVCCTTHAPYFYPTHTKEFS